jgi:hypothetical protein
MIKAITRSGKGFIVFSGCIALALAAATQATFAAASVSAGAPGQAGGADKPAGALRLAMAGIGVMRPIPWQETPFSKGYLTLLYDFLVGANADGSISTANGAAQKWEMAPDGMTWTPRRSPSPPSPHGCARLSKRSRWQIRTS